MNETFFILKQFEKDFKGKFLALGEWDDVVRELLKKEWTGVVADHLAVELSPTAAEFEGVQYVHGPIGMSPHLMEVGHNYKMRAITFRECLDNFAGPFNVILISVPGLGKDLATCPDMWTSWPDVLAVRSEGREQEIANLGAAHSYTPIRIERDAMILARPAKKESTK